MASSVSLMLLARADRVIETRSFATARSDAIGPLLTCTAQRVDVCFSNRPFGVKHFQAIRRCSVDVARGLVLLSGIGTKAVPSWDLYWLTGLRPLAGSPAP